MPDNVVAASVAGKSSLRRSQTIDPKRRKKSAARNSHISPNTSRNESKRRGSLVNTSKNSTRAMHWSQISMNGQQLKDLLFEEFKLRLGEHEAWLEQTLTSEDLPKAFEELIKNSRIKPTQQQCQNFVLEVLQAAANDPAKQAPPAGVPELEFNQFMIVVIQWYLKNKPELIRMLPVTRLV